jgi:hypothetical protein
MTETLAQFPELSYPHRGILKVKVLGEGDSRGVLLFLGTA